jgi:hypothetical protein
VGLHSSWHWQTGYCYTSLVNHMAPGHVSGGLCRTRVLVHASARGRWLATCAQDVQDIFRCLDLDSSKTACSIAIAEACDGGTTEVPSADPNSLHNLQSSMLHGLHRPIGWPHTSHRGGGGERRSFHFTTCLCQPRNTKGGDTLLDYFSLCASPTSLRSPFLI